MLEFISGNETAVTSMTALAAIVLSFISILLAAQTARAQQRHNRLSVKPFGKIYHRWNEREGRIILANSGLGPMIIDGVKTASASARNGDALKVLMQTVDDGNRQLRAERIGAVDWHEGHAQLDGYAAPPNEAIRLFAWKVRATDDEEPVSPLLEEVHNAITVAIADLRIDVAVKDVYGGSRQKLVFDGPNSRLGEFSQLIER